MTQQQNHDTPADDSAGSPAPSRRQFLAQTAALAGAGGLLAACQAGAPVVRSSLRARPRPDEPLRIGVIGTGGMGRGHIESLLKLAAKGAEKLEIPAVCDVCDSRLEAAQKKCDELQERKVETYTDHEKLLARDDLHGVLIATPEHWHGAQVEAAVNHGLHAYVEKPMTLRLPEALRLLEVTRANPDARIQVGTQFVMQPKYHHARRLIAEGAIGKPTSSQASYCRNSPQGEWLDYWINPEWQPGVNVDWDRWCGPLGKQPWDAAVFARWRRYRKYSTGIIGDLLVHVMTPLVFAFDQGWPTRVVASGGHYVDLAMENHDQVNITAEFERGHTLSVLGSTSNSTGIDTMIRGHHATLHLGGNDCVLKPEKPFEKEVEPQEITGKGIADQDQLRLDWLASIRTGAQVASPVELGAKVMVIVDLATRSMWDGRAYRFDPATLQASAV